MPTATGTCSSASSSVLLRSPGSSPTTPTCTAHCRRRTTSGIADGSLEPRGRVSAMHRRRQMGQEVERRVDEGEMRERLRKVAEQALRLGVVLLRDQADVVRERDEPLEE